MFDEVVLTFGLPGRPSNGYKFFAEDLSKDIEKNAGLKERRRIDDANVRLFPF